MSGIKLASAILRGQWMIDLQSAPNIEQIANNIAAGHPANYPQSEKPTYMQVFAANGDTSIVIDGQPMEETVIEQKSIAVLPISGVIMKDDFCGEPGSMTRARMIQRADAIEDIGVIILDIDSPGGMVDGTRTLVEAIRACETRTIAYINDGVAASAAYWIASACDEIYVSNQMDRIGSIGVYNSVRDLKGKLNKEGGTAVDVYAPESAEKNGPRRAAEEGDLKPMEALNSRYAQMFISYVKENRSGKINTEAGDPFKGKLFFADEALAIGLIDGIKSWEELVKEEFAQLAPKQGAGGQSNNQSIQIDMKQYALVSAAIMAAGLELQDGGAFLNEEQLNSLEAQLQSQKEAAEASAKKLEASEAALKAAEESVKASETLINELADASGIASGASASETAASVKAHIEQIGGGKPGEKPAAPKAAADVTGDETAKSYKISEGSASAQIADAAFGD